MKKINLQQIPWTTQEDNMLKQIIMAQNEQRLTQKIKCPNKWNEIAKELYN